MNKSSLILIGAGGHARACIDVIEGQDKYMIAGLVGTPEEVNRQHFDYAVIAADKDLPTLAKTYKNFLIAVGQIKTPEHRIRLYQLAIELGLQLPVVIASTAFVSRHATIGQGTIVMHSAIINAGVKVGNNCIINTRAQIEHDAVVEDHCHIATGAILNGDVKIGVGTFVGSGSVIKESVTIGSRVVIGMGNIVKHKLDDNSRLI